MNKKITLIIFISITFAGLISAVGYKVFSSFPEKETVTVPLAQAKKNNAQSKHQQAKTLLLKYARSMNGIAMPVGKKKYYFHYKVITQSVRKNEKESITEIRAYMSKDLSFYESDLISYYKDSAETYTIIHPQKIITRGKTVKENTASEKAIVMQPLQDSLYINAEVLAYADDVYNGIKVKSIEIKPDARMSKRTGMARIKYYYNEKENRMEAQEIWYVQGAVNAKSTYVFYEMNLKYKGKMKQDSKSYIYDQNTLKDKWKTYTVENK